MLISVVKKIIKPATCILCASCIFVFWLHFDAIAALPDYNTVSTDIDINEPSPDSETASFEVDYALGDLGEPRSSYNLGSAKILEGENIIVSLFVDSKDFRWTYKKKNETLSMLTDACDYLKEQASEYGKDVSFIYKWDEDFSLLKTARFDCNPDSEEFEDELDLQFDYWTKTKIDYDALLRRYNADNIFTMMFFGVEGRSFAVCYDGIDNTKESIIIFGSSLAAEYAHEILHLYGAHDYYKGAEYTDDVVNVIKKKYPDDIMLTISFSKKITNTVSNLTAYHLGWIDENEYKDIEFKNEFSQLRR